MRWLGEYDKDNTQSEKLHHAPPAKIKWQFSYNQVVVYRSVTLSTVAGWTMRLQRFYITNVLDQTASGILARPFKTPGY